MTARKLGIAAMNTLPNRLDALAKRWEDRLPPRDIKLIHDAALEIRNLNDRLTHWVRRAAAEARRGKP